MCEWISFQGKYRFIEHFLGENIGDEDFHDQCLFEKIFYFNFCFFYLDYFTFEFPTLLIEIFVHFCSFSFFLILYQYYGQNKDWIIPLVKINECYH